MEKRVHVLRAGTFLMDLVVDVRNVSKNFGLGSSTVKVLLNVTLELHAGELVASHKSHKSRES